MPNAKRQKRVSNKIHKREKQKTFTGILPFGVIAVLGSGLIIGILGLTYRLNSGNKDALIFFVTAAINTLIFLAIVIQAYIYKRQWEVMEATLRKADETFYVGKRAYVYLKRIEPITPLNFNGQMVVEIECVNAGHTPAWNLQVTGEFYIEDADFVPPSHVRKPEMLSERGAFLPANGSFVSISRSPKVLLWPEIEAILAGTDRVFLIGLCTYTDFTGAEHSEPYDVVLHVDIDGAGRFVDRDGEQKVIFRLTEKGLAEMMKRKRERENPT